MSGALQMLLAVQQARLCGDRLLGRRQQIFYYDTVGGIHGSGCHCHGARQLANKKLLIAHFSDQTAHPKHSLATVRKNHKAEANHHVECHSSGSA